MNFPDMMTVAQVAQAIHRSPRWVREQLIDSGKVRFLRPSGGRGPYLIYADSVAKLFDFERGRQQSPEYYRQRAAAAMARRGLTPPCEPGYKYTR